MWDRFAHTPGKIQNDDIGDVALNHYHWYKEDVQLMKGLGAKAYRFFPGGRRAKPGDVANNWEVELMLADQSADGFAEVLFKKTKEPYVKNAWVRSWLLAAAVLTLACSACTQTSPQGAAVGLGGTSWQLVKFQGSDDKTLTPDDKAKYTMAFGPK